MRLKIFTARIIRRNYSFGVLPINNTMIKFSNTINWDCKLIKVNKN